MSNLISVTHSNVVRVDFVRLSKRKDKTKEARSLLEKARMASTMKEKDNLIRQSVEILKSI